MSGLHIPRDAPWKSDVISEMMSFPVGVHDDACLVGTTMVDTMDGKKPIRDVQAGDWVTTPDGLKPVIASSLTDPSAEVYDVTFSDGRTITATGNHPVFVRGKGFVRVDALCIMDAVVQNGEHLCYEDRQRLKWSNTTATDTGATQKASTCTTGATSMAPSRVVGFSIGTCGRMLMGQYRKASTFITRMAIGTTIRSIISNASQKLSTAVAIHRLKRNLKRKGVTLSEYARELVRGTSPKLAGNGTENLPPIPGLSESLFPKRVSVAELGSKLTSLAVGASVLAPALSVTAITKREGRLPVYNLAVKDCPMFYANGVLTHNCDALGLVGQLLDRMLAGVPLPPKPEEPNPEEEMMITPPPLIERRRR